MNEDAIQVIVRYIQNPPVFPSISDSYKFDKLSYSIWAAGELLEELSDRPTTPANEIIDEFLMQMSFYAYGAKREDVRIIFLTAKSVAEYILELLERRAH